MKPKTRPPGAKPPRRDRDRQNVRPWNDLDVQLTLHFCPSLQRAWGVPPVVYESFDQIYPKLHKEAKRHGNT